MCAAITARMRRQHNQSGQGSAGENKVDLYNCAAAAASVLLAAGRSFNSFTDALELAGKAAALAGEVWL